MNVINKKDDWNYVLSKNFPELRDIYFEYDYFNLYAKAFNAKSEGLFWSDDNIKVFWTHLIRYIKKIGLYKDFNYFDLVTPYGYGGPLIFKKTENEENVKKSLKKFFDEYIEIAKKNNYICEFIRFHPLLKNWEPFKELIDSIYLNDIIVLDLTQDYEDIWRNMAKKTRYYTKKALEEFEEIIVTDNPSDGEINDFVSLYSKTMDKNKAPRKYYFSFDFIKKHFNFKTLLIYCKNKDNILGSSAMFIEGKWIMHYHLSSTNYYFKTSPSRAVLWTAIKRAKEKGLRWFHFGGGRATNDSLFDFKKGFSKNYLPFYIGKIIFNEEIYNKLNALNPLSIENPNFFPLYRVGYDKEII